MTKEELERTIGTILARIEGVMVEIRDLKQDFKEDRKEHEEFHAHMKSKWNEGFLKHEQWVTEQIKSNKEFATREINLLRTNEIEPLKKFHTEEGRDNRRFLHRIAETTLGGLIGAITTYFTLNK